MGLEEMQTPFTPAACCWTKVSDCAMMGNKITADQKKILEKLQLLLKQKGKTVSTNDLQQMLAWAVKGDAINCSWSSC